MELTLYKLYLGHDNQTKKQQPKKQIINIISKYFEGATISNVLGLWEGKTEKSTLIEIITDQEKNINLLKQDLKTTFKQDSILKITSNNKIEF